MVGKKFVYSIFHSWNFANGQVGSYSITFDNKEEALERFAYLSLLIQTDDYDFPVVIPNMSDINWNSDVITYSVYQSADCRVNRQDLFLFIDEIVL